MKDLQKSALCVCVGESGGLGAAYGRRFAKAGYRVGLAGRSAEKVEASAAEIQADGGQARALVGDASQEEDDAKFAAAAEAWAPLAVAVPNAGTNSRDSFLALYIAYFANLWRDNTHGAPLNSSEAAPRNVWHGSELIPFAAKQRLN